MKQYPCEKEFLRLSMLGNLIPVYLEVLADLDTPVSAYFKIAKRSKYSFLLESVEGQEKTARFSFLAKDPELVISSKDQLFKIIHLQDGKQKKKTSQKGNAPLSFIRDIMQKYKFVAVPGLPRFCGGLVGYLGYDLVRSFEKLPNKPEDDLQLPDTMLMLAKTLIIFDHRTHTIKVVKR